MDQRIDIELADKVAPGIAQKIDAIAASAIKADSALEQVRKQLTALDSPFNAILKQIEKNNAQIDKNALANQRLATEIQKTNAAALQAEAALNKAIKAQVEAEASSAKLAATTAKAAEEIKKLGETEQQAASRISAMVQASIAQATGFEKTATGATNAKTAIAGLTVGNQALLTAQNRSMAASSALVSAQATLNDIYGKTAKTLPELQAQTNKLVDAHNKGRVSAEEYKRAVAALDEQEAKMSGSLDKTTEAHKKLQFANAGTTREIIVLGHEFMTGNISKMPGSFMVLLERMGSLHSLLNPVTLGFIGVAAAAALVGTAIAAGHHEMVAMNNALLVTNNYAGQTRGTMLELADSMTKSNEVTIATAKNVVSTLVASGRIGGEAIKTIASLASDYAKVTGEDIDKIAPKLVSLFEDPVKGAEKLNASMHFLTTTDLEHIRTLERLGETQKAQQVLAELVTAALPKQAENVGTVEAVYNKLAGTLSRVKDSFMGIGRNLSTQQMLKEAENEQKNFIELFNSGRSKYGSNPNKKDAKEAQEYVNQLQNQIDGLKGLADNENKAAKAQAERAEQLDKQNKAQEAVNKSATYRIQTLQDEIKLIANAPDSADKKRREYELAKEIADLQRSLGAEGRQLLQEQAANALAIAEIKDKKAADEIETQLKLGKLTKEQADVQLNNVKLQDNIEKQVYEQKIIRIGGLSALELNQHKNKLQQLKEEADLIEQQGSNKALVDAKAAYDSVQEAVQKLGSSELKSLQETLKKQKEANAEIGVNASERQRLKQVVEQQKIAELELNAIQIQAAIDSGDASEADNAIRKLRLGDLKEEIRLRKEISGAIADSVILEANNQAAKQAAADWKQTAETINSSLYDAITNSGESAGRKLKSYFAKLVLNPFIQPLGNAGASLMYPGGAAANMASVGNASNIFSMGSSAFSAFNNGGLGGLADSVGLSGAYNTVAGWFGGTGAGLTGGGSAIGASTSLASMGLGGAESAAMGGVYEATATAAVEASTAAGAAAGTSAVTSALAAIPGWGWAALAAVAAYKVFGGGGETRYGGGYNYTPGGNVELGGGPDGGEIAGDKVKQAIKDSTDNINGLLKSFGSNAQVDYFTGGLESSQNGKGKVFAGANVGGQFVGTNDATHFDIGSVSQEQALVAFQDQLKVVTIKSLQAANIGGAVGEYLDSLGDINKLTSAQDDAVLLQIASLQKFAEALKTLPFDNLKKASFDTANQIAKLVGGFEALGTKLNSYYANYYTEEEKKTFVLAQVKSQLAAVNIALPTTREEFRKLVDAQDLTTASGRAAYAALLNSADAFASVVPAATAAAEAVGKVVDIAKVLQDYLTTATTEANNAYQIVVNAVAAQKETNQAAYDAQIAIIDAQASSAKTIFEDTRNTLQDAITASTQAVSKLTSLSSSIKNTLEQMMPEGSERTSRQQAQQAIAQAIATAKATGVLPDAADIAKSLQTVAQPSAKLFTNREDYLTDFYKTYNSVSELGDITNSKLTEAQQQLETQKQTLKTLEASYDLQQRQFESAKEEAKRTLEAQQKALDIIQQTAKDSLDAANGTKLAIMDLTSAIANLNSSIGMLAAAKASVSAGTPDAIVSQAYNQYLGRAPETAGANYWTSQITTGKETAASVVSDIKNSPEAKIQSLYGTLLGRQGDLNEVTFWMNQASSGRSITDIANSFVGSPEYIAAHPHASGLNYVPYNDYPARLHTGESVLTASETKQRNAHSDTAAAQQKMLTLLERLCGNSEKRPAYSSDTEKRMYEMLDEALNKGVLTRSS